MIGIVDFFLLPRIFFHRNTFERNLLFSNTRTDRRVIITCQRYRHGNLKYINALNGEPCLTHFSMLFIYNKKNKFLSSYDDRFKERKREKNQNLSCSGSLYFTSHLFTRSRGEEEITSIFQAARSRTTLQL